jgi:hypothetical protein
MGYQLTFSEDETTLTCRYTGDVSLEDILSAYAAIIQDPDIFCALRFLVCDYTEAHLITVANQDVQEIAEIIQNGPDLNPNLLMTVIMSTDLEFGLGRMWQVYTEHLSWDIHIVRTQEESDAILSEHS